MRFVDANVFIYAILTPRRALSDRELEIKRRAKAILTRINEGEEALTTVVHLSEVANVLEDYAGTRLAAAFIRDVLSRENIVVEAVSASDYLASSLLALEKGVSVNDALAYVVMMKRNIHEIYTFDKHFEKLNVKIVQE